MFSEREKLARPVLMKNNGDSPVTMVALVRQVLVQHVASLVEAIAALDGHKPILIDPLNARVFDQYIECRHNDLGIDRA